MENNDSSMTDRDRHMRESFESYDENDDDKKDKRKKRETKTPSLRSVLFGGINQESSESKDAQSQTAAWLERRKNRSGNQESLLKSILKEANAQRKSLEASFERKNEEALQDKGEKEAPKAEISSAKGTVVREAIAKKVVERAEENSMDTAKVIEPTKRADQAQVSGRAGKALAETVPSLNLEIEQTDELEQSQSKLQSGQGVKASPRRFKLPAEGQQQAETTIQTSPSEVNTNAKSTPDKIEIGPHVFQPSSPNIIAVATANVDPGLAKMNEFYFRRKNTGKIVLAGVLGYAIGLHSDNKKTVEQQLKHVVEHMPVQDAKEEAQVVSRQEEQFAQQLANADKQATLADESESREALNEQIVLQAEHTSESGQTASSAEIPVVHHTLERPKGSLTDSIEAHSQAPASKEIDARSMTMPELLQAAAKIEVGGSSLKELYEQNRIDAVNLRKIVAEHAAGRNYELLVTNALEAEEMKHELRSETRTSASIHPPKTDKSKKIDGKNDNEAQTIPAAILTEEAPLEPPPMLLERGSESTSTINESHATETEDKIQSKLPDPLYAPMHESIYKATPQLEGSTEYIRVPLPVAVAIGVVTGGVCAGLLLILIF